MEKNKIYYKLFLINLLIFILNLILGLGLAHIKFRVIFIPFLIIAISAIIGFIFDNFFKIPIAEKFESHKDVIKNHFPLFITIVAILATGIAFNQFFNNALERNINNHIYSSAIFGIPKNLEQKGIKPFYNYKHIAGWDGQFHYYISNDIFAKKDTIKHIDAPPYRYTRVGYSAFVNLVSKLLRKDWVSPSLYFCTYLILFFSAVFCFSYLFKKENKDIWLSLLWIGFCGNMLTMFNGLADCAADSFFVISLLFLYNINKTKGILKTANILLFIILMTFCVLSREVYILFMFSLFLFGIVYSFKNKKFELIYIISSAIPALVYIAWKIYITMRMGTIPTGGLVNYPFLYGIKNIFNKVKPENIILIPLLYCILFSTFYIGYKRLKENKDLITSSLALGLILTIILYICFGNTVMFEWSGYFKALGVILITTALIVNIKIKSEKYIVVFLSYALILNFCFYADTLIRPHFPVKYIGYANEDKYHLVKKAEEIPCCPSCKWDLKIISYEIENFGNADWYAIKVNLKNNSKTAFRSNNKEGGVWYLSGHWNIKKSKDARPTYIIPSLEPNESREFYIVGILPKNYSGQNFTAELRQTKCERNRNQDLCDIIKFNNKEE